MHNSTHRAGNQYHMRRRLAKDAKQKKRGGNFASKDVEAAQAAHTRVSHAFRQTLS